MQGMKAIRVEIQGWSNGRLISGSFSVLEIVVSAILD